MKSQRLNTCPNETKMSALTLNTLFAPGTRGQLAFVIGQSYPVGGQLDLATILWQVAGFKIAEDAVCIFHLSGENCIVKVELVTT